MPYREQQDDLTHVLTAIWERLGVLTDYIIKDRETDFLRETRISNLEHRVDKAEKRMEKTSSCLAFLKEVASPREWAIGIVILLALMAGIISPAEIKAYVLNEQSHEQK